ncbi:hypothetical protein [Terrabacter sp. Ter38]|uniref:hypothetical protein n=1 Tax=Terrabacter sp. Ter38 TaxID=2926030 RepID=UPI00211882F6|nr:hypothetical protein [Terrabacter sp. Ter38]
MLHVIGSTAFFLMVVNGIVAGTLGALVADIVGGITAVVAVVGTLSGVGYVVVHLAIERRVFAGPDDDERFPTPD